MDSNSSISMRAIFVSIFAFFYTFTRQTFLPCAKAITLPNFNDPTYMFGAGSITSYFGLIYSFLQIPYGIGLDYLGVNRMVLFLTGIMSTGLFICSMSTSAPMFALGRLITVFGCGGAFISTVKALNIDIGSQRVKSYVGKLIACSILLGIFFINSILDKLINIPSGWRYFYLSKAIIIGGVFVFFLGLNKKKELSTHVIHKDQVTFFKCLSLIKKNTKIIYILLFTLFFFMIFYSINETQFMASLLQNKLGILEKNTYILLLIGFLLGFLFMPNVTKVLGNIKTCWFNILVLSTLSILMIIMPSCILAYIFLFFTGFSNGMQMVVVEMACNEMPKEYTGMLAGIMNSLFVGGAFIPQKFLTFIIPRIAMGANIIFYLVIVLSVIASLLVINIESKKKIDDNV